MSIGSFCILISNRASEYVLEKENYNRVNQKLKLLTVENDIINISLKNFLSLKIQENSINKIINKCKNTIRFGCFVKKMDQILNEIENDGAVELDAGCLNDIVDCIENKNCSDFTKKVTFEKNFTPIDDLLINEGELDLLTEELDIFDKYDKEYDLKLKEKEDQYEKEKEEFMILDNKKRLNSLTDEEKVDYKKKRLEFEEIEKQYFEKLEKLNLDFEQEIIREKEIIKNKREEVRNEYF